MTRRGLNDARRRALLVIAEGDRRDRGPVQRSNRTSSPDDVALTVESRTARWLIDEGLAVDLLHDTRDGLRLTPAGRVAAGKAAHRPGAPR